MGILRVEGLGKFFGAERLFANVGFELRSGEKVGLIGANGTGKTTLMRCLMGLEKADEGLVKLAVGDTIGYVEQQAAVGDRTLYEELMLAYQDVIELRNSINRLEQKIAGEQDEVILAEMMREYGTRVEQFERGGGYEYENMIRRVSSGLGFSTDDLARDVSTFSGGQKTRISLAKALVRKPEMLFLDEPTNHLDIGMVEWLEGFLREYNGGVLVISHDRYFLDGVVDRIIELEGGELISYRGNYSAYLEQKAARLISQQAAYEKQQAYIAKTEAFINRYRAGIKAKQARGRESQLARLERLAAPEERTGFSLRFTTDVECAERVAELVQVTATYKDKSVFENLNLLIRRGERVVLIGPNGAGKSTVLKLLTGELSPVRGSVKLGSRVRVGYFSQEHEGLNFNNRVIDEIMGDFGFSEERARNYLGVFLFSNDDVFKNIRDLSGGEKARIVLLKLMLGGANFLVMDEPTNHLDIEAKEAVEEAILLYPGTFLVVSHDRYFMDKIADRVVELDNGYLTEYAGNYSYYRNKKSKAVQSERRGSAVKAKKNDQPRRRNPENTIRLAKKLEEEIAGLEYELAALEARLNDPESHADPIVSRELAEEYAQAQAKLAAKYDEWVALTESSMS
ncbi:MAG: transporter related protein [Firmicutes bacterium]|nr:transporter related protein [Bacillota bacterium]